jgi:hypothetical protein
MHEARRAAELAMRRDEASEDTEMSARDSDASAI